MKTVIPSTQPIMKTVLFMRCKAILCLSLSLIMVMGATAQWSTQTSGTGEDLRSVHFEDANTGWIVGTGGIIRKTTNGGTSWTTQGAGVTFQRLNSVFFVSTTTGWTAGNNGVILKTTNGTN